MAFCKCPVCGSVHTIKTPDGINERELTENDDIPEIMCPTCLYDSLELESFNPLRPLINTLIAVATAIGLLYVAGIAYRAPARGGLSSADSQKRLLAPIAPPTLAYGACEIEPTRPDGMSV